VQASPSPQTLSLQQYVLDNRHVNHTVSTLADYLSPT